MWNDLPGETLQFVFIAVATFLITSKVFSIYLPDVVFDPPLCRCCGYDLAGSPTAVCSECGHDQEA